MTRSATILHVGVFHFPDAVPEETIHQLHGYARACDDYAIWKDGAQLVGCQRIPIAEAIRRRCYEVLEQFGGTRLG